MRSDAAAVAAQEQADGLQAPLVAAYRGGRGEHTPVWFMRQAGRALPEYRAVRAKAGLLQITHTPELAAEVTLQPVRRYGVDAAILFSDIVSPLAAIGIELEIRPGVGPVIAHPVQTSGDLRTLRSFEPAEDAPWLAEACRLVVAEAGVPLIGFVGGPFTLASYLVEGGPSKAQSRTKALMLSDPTTWRALLERLRRDRARIGSRTGAGWGGGDPGVRQLDRLAVRRAFRAARSPGRHGAVRGTRRACRCRASTSVSGPGICSSCSRRPDLM